MTFFVNQIRAGKLEAATGAVLRISNPSDSVHPLVKSGWIFMGGVFSGVKGMSYQKGRIAGVARLLW